jgi:cytochrome c-type biogenesis protein CcmF
MASLGYFALLAAFVVCTYAGAVSVAGARRGSRRLVESGLGALDLTTALLSLASLVMVRAFVLDDYSIKYVQRYSDAVQPLFYKITACWGGLDGSMLFWAFLLAAFGSIAVHVNRDRHRELVPYAVAVIAFVQMFFLFVMIVHKNPFDVYLTDPPAAGRGLNPLLQNPYMAIHPPALYMGFVGMTIPYAFCMAALMTGRLDDAWLRAVRRWTMFSWLLLSFGLILGMIWAYEELGWGGFWAWDPVENAGLLPWFTATAFLHSVMVQERRNMLRVWNVSLVIVTFFLTIFGTFMTRSGVVQSLHAFGEDRELVWMFSIFMLAILAGSFALVLHRLPLLRVRHDLDSWVSREAAFVVNNWLLVFSAFFVLLATMFPTLSEALAGERLTVGPPFFTKWMVPIGLGLLGLTGVGPLLAWRKSTVRNLRAQFQWPVLAGAAAGALALALGLGARASSLCFALAAFVLGTVVQEFWRGAAVRRRATGAGALAAVASLFGRSRRRYGGYLVHVGVVLMFVGFGGEGLKQDRQVLLKPGERVSVGRFSIRHDAIAVTDDGQKQMITAQVTVFERDRERGTMRPARWFYRQHEEEPTTEVDIRRSPLEDLYVVMAGFDLKTQSATLQIVVTPLVSWIWIGFGVMAVGTLIALMDDRAFASELASLPPGAAARG